MISSRGRDWGLKGLSWSWRWLAFYCTNRLCVAFTSVLPCAYIIYGQRSLADYIGHGVTRSRTWLSIPTHITVLQQIGQSFSQSYIKTSCLDISSSHGISRPGRNQSRGGVGAPQLWWCFNYKARAEV